jgi:hypothetical protein
VKLNEIADRIAAHLRRMEADPVINVNTKPNRMGTSQFYFADARVAGAYVRVQYITYQGGTNLKKAEAEAYLKALDAGFTQKHWRLKDSSASGGSVDG